MVWGRADEVPWVGSGRLMAVYPGPCPPGFDYDPSTARTLIVAAERLAVAADDLARQARQGRSEVESAPFAGRTADLVRDRHSQLDEDLRRLAAAAGDQVDELRREIELGLDRAAEAAAAQQRWRQSLRVWQEGR